MQSTAQSLLLLIQYPAPVYVGPHVGTISNSTQVTSRLWMALGDPSQASPTGNWWSSEL